MSESTIYSIFVRLSAGHLHHVHTSFLVLSKRDFPVKFGVLNTRISRFNRGLLSGNTKAKYFRYIRGFFVTQYKKSPEKSQAYKTFPISTTACYDSKTYSTQAKYKNESYKADILHNLY